MAQREMGIGRLGLLAAAVIALATGLLGAGAATVPAESQARERPGKMVRVVKTDFGRVLADRRGMVYYMFESDRRRRSRCYGACARAWPPALTRGRPRAARGAKRKLIGVTRRRGGARQLTYAGRPLYYYEHDSPGVVLCQNVFQYGGLWLLLKRNGRVLR